MNAKEMFKELGYEDFGNRIGDENCVYENTITKQIGDEFYQQGICIIIEYGYIVKMEDNGKRLDFTSDEIVAIHQQMIELGWLDE
jgi:hypothetical protein